MKYKIEIIITSIDIPQQESIPEIVEAIFECSSENKIKASQEVLRAISDTLPKLRKNAGMPDA